MDFFDWIRQLATLLTFEANTEEQVAAAVHEGIRQSLTGGVTTLGDITRRPRWSRAALVQSALRTISFGEVIAVGKIRERLDAAIAEACSGEVCGGNVFIGLSPHSPYTVETFGLRKCAERAKGAPPVSPLFEGGGNSFQSLPICIHLAETLDEERFTLHGDGPIADLLKSLGVWDERICVPHMRPVELANYCGLLLPRTLLAHVNYVNDDDIGMIAISEASVTYCPRTHHAFGHAPHRFRDMLAAGVNVCVGTDSLASNPSLSILEELRFLRRNYSDTLGDALLEMGTINGARALGVGDICGTLSVGKSADFVVLPVSAAGGSWSEIFETDVDSIAVFAAGRHIDAPGSSKSNDES